MRSANSTSVTSAPKSRYMLAHSTPMAPAPTIVTRPGTSPRVSASSLVMIRRPSGSSPGRLRGALPVARMRLSALASRSPGLAAGDADAGRAGQHAVAAQDGHLVLLHQELDARHVLVDDRVAALAERAVVEADALVAGEAELGALLLHPVQEVGRLEQRLRRDAAAIQARAAELVALDEAHVQAELRGADGADVAHAAAEDQQVEALRVGHQPAATAVSVSNGRPSCSPMRRRHSSGTGIGRAIA